VANPLYKKAIVHLTVSQPLTIDYTPSSSYQYMHSGKQHAWVYGQ